MILFFIFVRIISILCICVKSIHVNAVPFILKIIADFCITVRGLQFCILCLVINAVLSRHIYFIFSVPCQVWLTLVFFTVVLLVIV